MALIASEYPPPDQADALRAAVISISEAAASLKGLELDAVDETDAQQAAASLAHLARSRPTPPATSERGQVGSDFGWRPPVAIRRGTLRSVTQHILSILEPGTHGTLERSSTRSMADHPTRIRAAPSPGGSPWKHPPRWTP